MKITEQKARIYKASHGWRGESTTTVKNQTYEISTFKTYSGYLFSHAMPVNKTATEGAVITSFSMFDPKAVDLLKTKPAKVTEAVVKDQHYKAISLFDEMVSRGDIQPQAKKEPQIGNILFLDGYGKTKGSEDNKHVIYKVENTDYGVKYYTVELDSLLLSVKDHVKPWSEKFGIGIYFEPDYCYTGSDEDLQNLLIDAHKESKVREAEREEANRIAAIEREKKEKYLSQFVKADRRKTTSIIKSHILKTWPVVSKVEVKSDVFSMGTSIDVYYYAPEEIEAVNDFIEGFQYGHFNGMEDIYESYKDMDEIIIDGHILVTYKYASAHYHFAPAPAPVVKDEAIKSNAGDVEIVSYSERAIAVIGNTKPIKEDLKALGGRFNFRLTCGPGWIFPKSKESDVKNLIGL